MTLRDHLRAAAQMIPDAIADLKGPEMPPDAWFAWQEFIQLHRTRQATSAGVQRIPHTEILAYSHNMHIDFTPLDVLYIIEADDALQCEMAARVAPPPEKVK